MRCLIVEDDNFKLERIRATIKRDCPLLDASIANSVGSAIRQIGSESYDLIVLDMALPSHDLKAGGAPPSSLLSGGIEVIMELSFLERGDPVVVMTQYPEIEIDGLFVSISAADERLRNLCQFNLQTVIQYKHDSSVWESDLRAVLGRLR